MAMQERKKQVGDMLHEHAEEAARFEARLGSMVEARLEDMVKPRLGSMVEEQVRLALQAQMPKAVP